MIEKTTTELILEELKEVFKDEPNKNMIIGITMGIIEKHKTQIFNESLKILNDKFIKNNK
jgi:hypothetical protein